MNITKFGPRGRLGFKGLLGPTSICIALSALFITRAWAAAGGIAEKTADVDGLKLHYLAAGSGPTVILLHGYTQTSRMWRPIIPKLAERFRVIAPDLPGIGDSEIPRDGLDMKTAAIRIHDLAKSLGVRKAEIVGHDIGLMVAYAYAAQFPSGDRKAGSYGCISSRSEGMGGRLRRSAHVAFSIFRSNAGSTGTRPRRYLLRMVLERSGCGSESFTVRRGSEGICSGLFTARTYARRMGLFCRVARNSQRVRRNGRNEAYDAGAQYRR